MSDDSVLALAKVLGASNLALVNHELLEKKKKLRGSRIKKIPSGPEAYIANYSGHELV